MNVASVAAPESWKEGIPQAFIDWLETGPYSVVPAEEAEVRGEWNWLGPDNESSEGSPSFEDCVLDLIAAKNLLPQFAKDTGYILEPEVSLPYLTLDEAIAKLEKLREEIGHGKVPFMAQVYMDLSECDMVIGRIRAGSPLRQVSRLVPRGGHPAVILHLTAPKKGE